MGEAWRKRHQAGLSVAQVSQLTRIKEAIIRGIEGGDCSACGGDFYARGTSAALPEWSGPILSC